MVILSAFPHFTDTGVINGAQIKTPQERKETRVRAEKKKL